MTTLQELQAQHEELTARITKMQSASRQEAIAKIRGLMSEYGLSAADLVGARTPGATSKKGGDPARKVAAKYRDPASGSTWTGRGLRPKWMQAALASGKKAEDFVIQAASSPTQA